MLARGANWARWKVSTSVLQQSANMSLVNWLFNLPILVYKTPAFGLRLGGCWFLSTPEIWEASCPGCSAMYCDSSQAGAQEVLLEGVQGCISVPWHAAANQGLIVADTHQFLDTSLNKNVQDFFMRFLTHSSEGKPIYCAITSKHCDNVISTMNHRHKNTRQAKT